MLHGVKAVGTVPARCLSRARSPNNKSKLAYTFGLLRCDFLTVKFSVTKPLQLQESLNEPSSESEP
jgi:hypothetical protein